MNSDMVCLQRARIEFHLNSGLDSVLLGLSNKAVYETAARRHVRSAIDGFNVVIFAYGQTASGKTFVLVRPIPTVPQALT